MDTYITLTVLLVGMIWLCNWLIHEYFDHEKNSYHFFDLPLDNKGKWWYNNNRK